MKVDRNQFESIVGSLLRQKPATRKEQRTGQKKHVGQIIPKPQSAPQSKPDKEEEKSESSC